MQTVDPVLTSNTRPNLITRLITFLKRHPLLFLLLLTPGIPEYLSSSSSLTLLVINPIVFLLLLGANMGLYGSGSILIREAMIRWKKGYATVIALGMGYAILEEGLALRTLYNPLSPVVGTLGIYGHWIGINWVWTAGLLIFHSVYSIALPIFLFGLVFPELRRQSLVGNRGISISMIALGLDSIFLTFIANYDPGSGILLASGLAVLGFTFLGKKLPANLFRTKIGLPKHRPRSYSIYGILLFPSTLLTGAIAASANLPPIIPIVLDFLLTLLILKYTFQSLGNQNNQEHKTAFAIGLLIPVVLFGMVAGFGIQNFLVLAGDLLFVLFSRRLWKKWHYWTMLQRFSPHPFAVPSDSPIVPM